MSQGGIIRMRIYPVEKKENEWWYHSNNVAGLMIISFASGVMVSIYIFYIIKIIFSL